jgi:hypothetical protein
LSVGLAEAPTGGRSARLPSGREGEGSGIYTVEVEAQGRAKKIVEARLGESVSLGEIRL